MAPLGEIFYELLCSGRAPRKVTSHASRHFLNCAGEEARDIFDSFNVEVTADATTCDVVLQRFRTYCNPKKRPAFESFKFWQRQQAEGEPFDKWLMELRVIGRNCEFGDTFNRQLRDKILFGTGIR